MKTVVDYVEELTSPTEEPVQKTKLAIVAIILWILGSVFFLLGILCRIPDIKTALSSLIPALGSNIIYVILGIALVLLIIAAVIDTHIRKHKMMTKSYKKASLILSVLCWILAIVNIVFMLLKWN